MDDKLNNIPAQVRVSGFIVNLFISCCPQAKYGVRSPKFLAGLRIRIHFIRIRIQHWLNIDPDSIRIQGFSDQTWEKKLKSWKKFNLFFDKKLQFTYP